MYETFWLDPTDRERRSLRRYARDSDGCPAMPGSFSYHEAQVAIEDGPAELYMEEGREYHRSPEPGDPQFNRDQRWLEIARCKCGYEFTSLDRFQVNSDLIYRRHDTGEEMTLRDAPVGALWVANWMGGWARGDDGLAVVCKCPPNHDWTIDGQASNCTRQGEPHHCWVRHGTRYDRLTVNKDGNTCAAGGGSIWVDMPNGWHGFLTNGWLHEVAETPPA